ncbi:acyl-CoA dehydrogenase [Hellea balneolensis]|uniref:acyl-CoA dehydrogenase n=1 Tax=Hellea balneolensis TaxID=287478 RepID=UPI0003F94AFC|nr:acyl-CoA dehydrogenase [Hellea balneolensis]
MDFRFTEGQQDLIDAAKAFFDGENTIERMRKTVAGEQVSNLWPQFAQLGLLGIMAPESAGGLEQPLVVMAGIAEAAGYAGVSEPYVEIAGITVPHAKKGELSGPIQRAMLSDLRPYIDASLAESGEVVNSIDPLRNLVKAKDGNDENAESANVHGAILTAAQLIGLSQRMVDMSVVYAKDRHQFGKPIGSFQAVKHQLANVYTQIEFTRPIIHLAAIKGGAAVHNAKVAAIDTAMLASETAIQVHGGMGYTYEVDLHLFMKRAWALCGEWGDRNYHMKRLEDYVLNGDAELGPGQTFN